MFYSVDDLMRAIVEHDIRMVDLQFCSLFGSWHHLTLPTSRVNEEFFTRGEAFDGASVAGFAKLEAGDMSMLPDVTTAFFDPFYEIPTLSVVCNIVEADTLEPCSRDPRGIAVKAEQYLKTTGFATNSVWGPEIEFYVFDSINHGSAPGMSQYRIESQEAPWNPDTGSGNALGYQIQHGRGYHACPPIDRLADVRNECVELLEHIGIPIRYHHHEVGGPGQCEIEPSMGPIVKMGDAVMLSKYVIRRVAEKWGLTVTFMPKPLYGEAGSGMHFHQHLFNNGEPVFYDESGYAGLSQLAHAYIGGLLEHGPSLLGLTNPSTNSYKRLVPGFEAPVNLFYSLGNRSAAIRIPKYAVLPYEKRIEFRPPDATCNPYLAMAAMLMAGIDGMKRSIDPKAQGFGPIDENIFEWPKEKLATIKPMPDSLTNALQALQRDQEYLTVGNVFTKDLLEAWIARKWQDIRELQARPHPHEFAMYYTL